jgi:hypothetical protein
MRRVASGEYNPEKERCIELSVNPASKIKAIRSEELAKLKRENEALLDRLSDAGSASTGEKGGIPVESFERLRKEKEDLEKAHAKRLQRLKEVSWSRHRLTYISPPFCSLPSLVPTDSRSSVQSRKSSSKPSILSSAGVSNSTSQAPISA